MQAITKVFSDIVKPYIDSADEDLQNQVNGLIDNQAVNGIVNMLPNTFTSQTIGSTTWTKNDDGTVVATKTSSTASIADFTTVTLPAGSYRLSGCPSGGSDSMYNMSAGISGGAELARDKGSTALFTLSETTTLIIKGRVGASLAVSTPVNFKPMISFASLNLGYDDYVPFAKNNKELTEDASSLLQTLNNGDLLSFLKIRDVVMNIYWTDNATPSDFTQLTTTQVTDMVQAMLDTFKKLGGASNTVYFGRFKRRNLKANGEVISEAIYTPFLVAARETYDQMLSQTTEQGTNAGVITFAFLNIGSSSLTLMSKWGNDIRYEVVGNSAVSKIYQNWTRITTYKG